VIGLPEINTSYTRKPFDTIRLEYIDAYSGGYGPPVLISRTQTFQPVKTIKEAVYDKLSKANKVKVTSLFLLDDFKKIKKKETLFLSCQGVFGYPRQSQAYMDNFVSALNVDLSLLSVDRSDLVADKSWYKAWLKNAPKAYWDPRMSGHYHEQHQSFEYFLEKYKPD
ncbi:MAG: Unknown protein, partial [uncultured Aureispira sp.]